jgi:hypothetical protein
MNCSNTIRPRNITRNKNAPGVGKAPGAEGKGMACDEPISRLAAAEYRGLCYIVQLMASSIPHKVKYPKKATIPMRRLCCRDPMFVLRSCEKLP